MIEMGIKTNGRIDQKFLHSDTAQQQAAAHPGPHLADPQEILKQHSGRMRRYTHPYRASAVDIPSPEKSPLMRPSESMRCRDNIPTGPTGAATAIPMKNPLMNTVSKR